MYPYNFQARYRGIRHNVLFIAMSFAPKHDWIYNDLIVPAIQKTNKRLGLNGKLELMPYLYLLLKLRKKLAKRG